MNFKPSNWGIGMNATEHGEATSYGKPASDDPDLFFPDPEACSQIELDYHDLCKQYKRQCEASKELLKYKERADSEDRNISATAKLKLYDTRWK